MGAATFIKETPSQGKAALYRLSPPYSAIEYGIEGVEFVIVSAVVNGYINETMVFPASESGEVRSWSEITCVNEITCANWQSHADALDQIGYDIEPRGL